MKPSTIAAIALLLFSSAALAEPLTDATIRELLQVTDAKNLIEKMRSSIQPQMDTMMNKAIQSGLNGNKPNAKQQHAIDKMKQRTIELSQSMLSWERFEPMVMRLYKQTFTEEEAAGMLAFYKTPAGQAVIRKMPQLMQNMGPEIQQMVTEMVPKQDQILQDFRAEVQAAGK